MGLRRRAVGKEGTIRMDDPRKGANEDTLPENRIPQVGGKQMTGRAVERAAKRRVPQEKTARTEGPKGSQPKPADKDTVAQVPADRKWPVPQMGRRAGWQKKMALKTEKREETVESGASAHHRNKTCHVGPEGTLRKGTSGHTEYKTIPRRKCE